MRGIGMKRVATIVTIVAASMALEMVPWASAQQNRPRARSGGVASIDTALQQPLKVQTKQLREGVVLDEQLGTFKTAGDRILFQLAGQGDELKVLENLALERIWKMLNDTRGRQWSVSGTVTEYRGGNYLLIDRVVLRSQSRLPVAETVTVQPNP